MDCQGCVREKTGDVICVMCASSNLPGWAYKSKAKQRRNDMENKEVIKLLKEADRYSQQGACFSASERIRQALSLLGQQPKPSGAVPIPTFNVPSPKCKTCGGSGEVDDAIHSVNAGIDISKPCPDCQVNRTNHQVNSQDCQVATKSNAEGELVKKIRDFAHDAENDFTYGRLKEGRHTQDYVKSIGLLRASTDRIEQLEIELKTEKAYIGVWRKDHIASSQKNIEQAKQIAELQAELDVEKRCHKTAAKNRDRLQAKLETKE